MLPTCVILTTDTGRARKGVSCDVSAATRSRVSAATCQQQAAMSSYGTIRLTQNPPLDSFANPSTDRGQLPALQTPPATATTRSSLSRAKSTLDAHSDSLSE